ncbi:hypothetical protein [Lusitaniella coriacea]|uniref:hypothetical protein n=1 Tax=Lusitaniella coriacea TaxID=1983105 RepID=UPI003CF62C63
MKIYWKDIEDYGSSWSGLAVRVESAKSLKPHFRLEVGEKQRIKLINRGNVIFWATIDNDYSRVSVLKTFCNLTVREMPIQPITSRTVEALKEFQGKEKLKRWCRFFVEELKNSHSSFFYNGFWLMTGFIKSGKEKVWEFESTGDPRYFSHKYLYEARNVLKNPTALNT